MSNFMFLANGDVHNSFIEKFTEVSQAPKQEVSPTAKPNDSFLLGGNLKLTGLIKATDFIKEDGSVINSVVKLALPNNVSYVDNRMGINTIKPNADLDVRGNFQVSGSFDEGKLGGVMTLDSDSKAEGVYMNFNHQGKRAGFIMGDNRNGVKQMLIQPESGNKVTIGGNLQANGNITYPGGSIYRNNVDKQGHSAVQVKNKENQGAYFWINDADRVDDGGFSSATIRNDAGNMRIQSKGGKGLVVQSDSGRVVVDEDIFTKRHLNVGENANITGDIAFNGPNKWIIHTPDDARRIMYIAPGNDKGEWMWDKQTMISNNGNVQLSGGLMLGSQDVPHSDDGVGGAFYRSDGQVQIATNDLIRLRHAGSKQTGIQFDLKPGEGDIKGPNGQMKITRQGIMFGGPNDGREHNSGQISAGLHIPNSLNIVGMSSDKGHGSRRIDMWAEGGLNVYGPQKINGSDGEATLGVKGSTHEHGTAWLRSDKGPNVSHVHWGDKGDWYLRSANAEGSVNIQDTAPNGNTNIGSNLNLKGGKSIHNPDNWGTHFPWGGDQKNYIRGDTEIRGDLNNIGLITTDAICMGQACIVQNGESVQVVPKSTTKFR